MQRKWVILTSCGVLALSAPQLAAAQSAAPVNEIADGNEIIVTASKRAEKLQDVPTAITAVSGEKIEALGIRDFRDYASLVPGLSQRDSGAPGTGTIILRGLNSGAQQTSNTSAVYIDETPFSPSGFLSVGALLTPSPELAEVERIEVLKGPQGTLYGASNLGGLVRIITKKPDASRFFGTASAEVSSVSHGEMGFLVRGSVNVPIVQDQLALTATGYYRRAGGFADNVTTGTNDVNRSNLYGGRVALRYQPTPDFTFDLSGIYQNIENEGYAFQRLVPGTFQAAFGRYDYASYADLGADIKYRIVNTNAEYRLGFGTLTASGSYARYKTNIETDATNPYIALGRTVLGPLAVPVFGVPIDTLLPANSVARFQASPNMEKWTGEVRLASDRMGAFEFMIGGFYTDEDSIYYTTVFVHDAQGNLRPAPRDALVKATTTSRYKELAGFGNVTFYLTDTLDITGGLRYAHNKQVAGTGGPGGITYYLPRTPLTFNFSDNSLSYLATLRWRPAPNISAYLRAASGYRPGGPQTNPTPPPGAQTFVRPDTVWNYEAGVKGSVLDGGLSFDISAFRIEWKDIQLNSLVNGIILQGNAASAVVDGFELQLTARPSDLLTVNVSAGHTNARLKAIDPTASSVTGAQAGNKLPLTPSWTTAILIDHQIPFSTSVSGNVGATLRFQSDMPSNYPVVTPVGQRKIPEITTVDLRASATFNERFTAQVRVDNLFDKLGFTNIGVDSTVIRPRTITAGLSAKF